MKNLFTILPEEFFKPLVSKYKKEYIDCLVLIFASFKPEITYGVDREIVLRLLEDYFTSMSQDMITDNNEILTDARGKANAAIKSFKDAGWLEYEQGENHSIQVSIFDYAIPIIESFHRIMKEEEAEYQSIISGIYSRLHNQESYKDPYPLILKAIAKETEQLVSELKRLNISIKRHMENQTNQMSADEILEHFFTYHREIGSKSYLRMKTSDNVARFRSAILDKLEDMLSSTSMMKSITKGYMETEQELDEDKAYDEMMQKILEIKSAFNHLDDIIAEIDRKHTRYMKNAVMRARFLLSTGNNMEGKISQILASMVAQLNEEVEHNIYDDASEEWKKLFQIYPQAFIDNESQRTIPVTRYVGNIDNIGENINISEEERALYREVFMERNRLRFSRKTINSFVEELLEGKERIKASSIVIESRRDMIRIIYISLYGNNKANCYAVDRTRTAIKIGGYTFPDFDIIRSDRR